MACGNRIKLMKNTTLSLLLLILCAACNNTADGNKKIANVPSPIADDEPFDTFKHNFQEAIRQKDLKKLKPLFADTIMESKDGCGYPGCTQDDFFEIYFASDSAND